MPENQNTADVTLGMLERVKAQVDAELTSLPDAPGDPNIGAARAFLAHIANVCENELIAADIRNQK